jgi:hypothetical protein
MASLLESELAIKLRMHSNLSIDTNSFEEICNMLLNIIGLAKAI